MNCRDFIIGLGAVLCATWMAHALPELQSSEAPSPATSSQ